MSCSSLRFLESSEVLKIFDWFAPSVYAKYTQMYLWLFCKLTLLHSSTHREIPSDSSLILKIKTDACKGTDTEVNYLEHVQAVVTANSTRRGDLEMFLTSPMGTTSMILSKRANDDDHRDGFTKWPFMTTHTWGEYPHGTWTLEVRRRQIAKYLFLFFTYFLLPFRSNSIRLNHAPDSWKNGLWFCMAPKRHRTEHWHRHRHIPN